MDRLWIRLSLAFGTVIGLTIIVPLIYLNINDNPSRRADDLILLEDSRRRRGEPLWWEISEAGAQILGIATLLGVISGVLFSRIISAPISKLAAAAQQIGDGQLDTRLQLDGSREVRELAEVFNQMVSDLQQAEIQRNNLMADVAHELRTPLTALEANLHAALDHVYELDEAELAHLYGQTRHLIRLINDLRELALAEANQLPLQMKPVVIDTLIHEAVAIFELTADDKAVQLETSCPVTLPQAMVDEARIRQVLHNLLANAIRHTPSGGVVTIVARATEEDVQIAISDTGEGIDPQQLPHIFDRFYRADKARSRDRGGSGLGLAIVKAIVEGHTGSVQAHSAGFNQGSTFTISLPQP
ncbi:MAG: ATP-binding protein [Chloroflexota bacterium]